MKSDRVPVNLLGTTFSLKTEDDPAYLSEIIKLYSKKIDKIRSDFSLRDPLKCAIMAGIFLTDELQKTRASSQEQTEKENRLKEAEHLTAKMIALLEENL